MKYAARSLRHPFDVQLWHPRTMRAEVFHLQEVTPALRFECGCHASTALAGMQLPAYPHLMSTLTVASLPSLLDPCERAKEAERLAAWHAEQAHAARLARNAALQEAFKAGTSRPRLTAKTGINIATVKAVTR